MADRHPGLTAAAAGYIYEAACVCLDRHHTSPVTFGVIDGSNQTGAIVMWDSANEQTRAAHGNETDATEAGACACALASTELIRGLLAMGRAETLTGADYYLAPEGTELGDWEECIRLEVSGTDRGGPAELAARLAQKLEQARQGQSNLPAMAAVVGFQTGSVLMKDVAAL
jgi:hypothetical protein